jgi:serine/threonine protein kinase/S1-C subfamily serine protease
VGALVDSYELVELLHRGDASEVWRARQVLAGRDVAIKFLGGDPAAIEAAVRRFENEWALLGGVRHPAILRPIDRGQTEDARTFIVSDLVHGESLSTMLARAPIASTRALAVLEQALEAIAEVHARGVVHRELSSSKLMIETIAGRDHLRILDFGTSNVSGRPGYMAPEQIRGEPSDVRADLYALGAIAHECLSGGSAFSGKNPLELMSAQLAGTPASLEYHPAVDPHLARWVMRMLSSDRERRPKSAEGALRELRDARAKEHEAFDDGRETIPQGFGEGLTALDAPTIVERGSKRAVERSTRIVTDAPDTFADETITAERPGVARLGPITEPTGPPWSAAQAAFEVARDPKALFERTDPPDIADPTLPPEAPLPPPEPDPIGDMATLPLAGLAPPPAPIPQLPPKPLPERPVAAARGGPRLAKTASERAPKPVRRAAGGGRVRRAFVLALGLSSLVVLVAGAWRLGQRSRDRDLEMSEAETESRTESEKETESEAALALEIGAKTGGGFIEPNAASPAAETRLDPRTVGHSVVSVITETERGSGFVAAKGGYILTARHAVASTKIGGTVRIRGSSESGPIDTDAMLIGVSEDLDLALVLCAHCRALAPLLLGSGSTIDLGATVYAFGSPVGLDNTLSRGIISHRGRLIGGIAYVQSDVSINPGSSGGPLLDESGRVIGIVSAKIGGAEGITFALPIEYALDGEDPILAELAGHPNRELRPSLVAMIASATPLELRSARANDARAAPEGQDPRAAPERPPSDPRAGGRLGIEITSAQVSGRVYGVRWKLKLPTSRGYEASDRFFLGLAHDRAPGGVVALGHLTPTQIMSRADDGKTTYSFEYVAQAGRGADVSAETVAEVRMNEEYRSSPVRFGEVAGPTSTWPAARDSKGSRRERAAGP